MIYVWDADYPWDVRTEKVCRTMVAAGWDVHIVARNKKQAATVERLPEGTVHRMPPLPMVGPGIDAALGFPAFFSPRWLGLLESTVRAVRPDVIVVRDLPLCPTAIRVGRRHGITVVLDMAENYPALIQQVWDCGRATPLDYLVRNPRAVRAVERWALPRVERIITVVEESADRVRALGIDPSRIDVVGNAPSRDRAETPNDRRRAPDAPLRTVYLGNMELTRGIAEVLEAIAALRRGGHDVRGTFIGRGRDLEELRARAVRLGLDQEAAHFTGWIAGHDTVLEMMAAADVGLVPHHVDEAWNTTIPNKLFDYMAAAMPVLSSDTRPCRRIIEETGCGEVYRSGDAADLEAALRRLLDPAHRARCGEAGRQAVLAQYNWELQGAEFLRSVEQALAGTARARR